ncbi:hypothetical protein ACFYPB_01970 [Streptomyces olivaceoviridis]
MLFYVGAVAAHVRARVFRTIVVPGLFPVPAAGPLALTAAR